MVRSAALTSTVSAKTLIIVMAVVMGGGLTGCTPINQNNTGPTVTELQLQLALERERRLLAEAEAREAKAETAEAEKREDGWAERDQLEREERERAERDKERERLAILEAEQKAREAAEARARLAALNSDRLNLLTFSEGLLDVARRLLERLEAVPSATVVGGNTLLQAQQKVGESFDIIRFHRQALRNDPISRRALDDAREAFDSVRSELSEIQAALVKELGGGDQTKILEATNWPGFSQTSWLGHPRALRDYFEAHKREVRSLIDQPSS